MEVHDSPQTHVASIQLLKRSSSENISCGGSEIFMIYKQTKPTKGGSEIMIYHGEILKKFQILFINLYPSIGSSCSLEDPLSYFKLEGMARFQKDEFSLLVSKN